MSACVKSATVRRARQGCGGSSRTSCMVDPPNIIVVPGSCQRCNFLCEG